MRYYYYYYLVSGLCFFFLQKFCFLSYFLFQLIYDLEILLDFCLIFYCFALNQWLVQPKSCWLFLFLLLIIIDIVKIIISDLKSLLFAPIVNFDLMILTKYLWFSWISGFAGLIIKFVNFRFSDQLIILIHFLFFKYWWVNLMPLSFTFLIFYCSIDYLAHYFVHQQLSYFGFANFKPYSIVVTLFYLLIKNYYLKFFD